jgi:outer membrane protein assembly factor BamB
MMKMTRLLNTTVIVAAATVASFAGDWPQWRGLQQNGISTETGWSATWPKSGPKQLWKAQVGMGFASFVVSDGRVYTTGNASDKDTIFCFDANTGAVIWKHTFPAKLDAKYYEGGTSATPTVEDGKVYAISKRGVVHCLDAAKGTVIWTNDLMGLLKLKMPEWGFAGSVILVGDTALLNAGTTGTALDKKTGKVLWTSGNEEAGYSTPVLFDANGEKAAILFTKQDTVAVKVSDGKVLWRFPWKTSYDVNAADPILSDGKVFVSSGYNGRGALYDVSGAQPKEIWLSKNMRSHFNPAILVNGFLYGIDGDSTRPESALRCVDWKTGEPKWTEKTGFGSVTVADGKLIVLTAKGELLVANASPDGFKPISRAQILGGKCWTTPVLANGKIYARNAAGQVVCVDVSGK